MTEDGVKAILAAVTADMLIQNNQPWAGTAGVALAWGGPWVMRRTSAALEILRKQLQHIHKSLLDSQREEFAAMLNRYLRNAQEGAAERNLQLIAKVMAGMLERETLSMLTRSFGMPIFSRI